MDAQTGMVWCQPEIRTPNCISFCSTQPVDSVAGFFWDFLLAGFIARLRATLETHDQNPASSSFNEYINIIPKTHPFDLIF